MHRRTFLKTSAVSALGSTYLLAGCASEAQESAAPASAAATGSQTLDRIGVQLYTVRSLMQEDVPGTLAAVAAIGYTEFEFAGYFGHSPEAIKGMLDEHGVTAPAAHMGLDALQASVDETIRAAQIVGHNYIVIPYLAADQRTMEGYQNLITALNTIGATCKDAGIQLGYHNHDFEFDTVGGKVAFDMILDDTDPELVAIELDLFWTAKVNVDPLAYFERYPGRFHLCHVKDMADASGEQRMVSVGAGEIDFASIFAQSEQAGLKHYIVEHDRPEDPLANIRASYAHVSTLTFG